MSELSPISSLTRGQLFERRCLGTNSYNSEIPYLQIRDGIGLVKLTQSLNWKPENPSTHFGKGLLEVIRFILDEMLRVAKSNTKYRLELFNAVDTPLDRHHGVDAFLSLCDIDVGHDFIVTLDLTLNPGKVVGKADFIIDEKDADFLERMAFLDLSLALPELITQGEKESYKKITEIVEFLWLYWHHFNEIYKLRRQSI